jgi:CRISPR system Cascade subunit CasE
MAEDELYLIRIQMNARNAKARRDLRDVGELHRTVMSMFPDVINEDARRSMGILHRLDIIHDFPILLVQASVQPDLDKLPKGYADGTALTSMTPLIEMLKEGLAVRYRILANATKRPKSGPMGGRRIALGVEDAKTWWERRAPEAGLLLADRPNLVSETLTGTSSKNSHLTLRPWRIDGMASVGDVGKLTTALRVGMGRGRAYGCGMLSVAILKAR